ncbi:MAG: hypothetical protein Q7R69_00345 [bacterium]|nr:hypothetical protein [bacterium]
MRKILIIIILFSLPLFAGAVTAVIEVDTGTETINAIEGTLVLPTNVSVENIYTGNSAVLIWVTSPELLGNTIPFAGITPGGFRGKYRLFAFDASNIAGFSFNNIKAYKNDGSGESVSVRLSLRQTEIAEDTVPPEPFEPIISTSPDIFGGRHFISFTAQDKGTGVERYEAASTWFLSPRDENWIETESPLVLSHLETFQKIHIRAVDKAGNHRDASTAGPYHYASVLISIIILLCVLLLLRRSLRSRFF